MRLPSVRDAVRVALSDPAEALDRLRNRVESWREPAPSAGAARSREEIRRDAERSFGVPVAADWERALHERLGAAWPCPEHDAFADVWAAIDRELASARRSAGSGLDADPTLGRAMWCLVRHLRPERVVETGVSRGITARCTLEALARNGTGRLWSIDLPPQDETWRDEAGSAVPARMRDRWTFLRGSSRRLLPRLLRELGEVDVFLHDSQHTERNMDFELRQAWPRLRPGGVLISDDVHENAAFAPYAPHGVVGQQARKAGLVGVAFRPGL